MLLADVNQEAKQVVDFFHGAILPALALLATGAAKTILERMQNQSRMRRSEQLTKRLSELETILTTLPARAPSPEMEITPQMAVTNELKQAIAELNYLQTRVHYSFHQFCSDVSFRTRRALVLYRPRGFFGWVLHSFFYGYLLLVLVAAIFIAGVINTPDTPDSGNPQQQTAQTQAPSSPAATAANSADDNPTRVISKTWRLGGDILVFMLMFSVLSIPAWIVRYFALKRLDKDAGCAPPSTAASFRAATASASPPQPV